MKTLLLSVFLFLTNVTCKEAPTVYICDSSGAKRYHLSSTCKGLSNCQHKILKVSLDAAKRKGRTLCGFED